MVIVVVYFLNFPKSISLDHVSSCNWAWPSLVDITMSNTWETWLQNNEEIWSHPKCNLSENFIKQHGFPIKLSSISSFSSFKVNISFCDLYYESSLSCACKFSRGGYVNIENLYKSVFRQTRLEKHLEYDNPRLQTQKRAQIEYWGVTRHSAGEQMRALFFVAIQ